MIVKKWLPYPLWDFAGIEQWLNEQAQAGYLLNGWPGWAFIGRVPFRTDPDAPRTRYCLDPGMDLFGEEELRRRAASYRDAGWQYEGNVRKYYAIYSCDDPKAPDLYNDTQSMNLAMKKQVHRMWLSLLLLVVWLGLALWDEWILIYTRPGSFVSGLILNSDIQIPLLGLLLLCVVLVVFSHINAFWGIFHIRACLRRGAWPTPGKRIYLELWRGIIALCLLLVAILSLLYLFWFSDSNAQRLSGPEEWSFPHIAMEEVIPYGTKLQLDTKQTLHWDQFCHSTLAPEQYDVSQRGVVEAVDGQKLDARVDQQYIRCISSTLAHMVYQGKLEDLRRHRADWTETELSLSGPDSITLFAQQERTIYIGLAGKQVFFLDCSGAADADIALSLLLNRLDADI